MQSEAMIRKAAEAIWAIRREEEDRCDMSLDDMGGEESSVWHEAKSALEAALSTDAEPVKAAPAVAVKAGPLAHALADEFERMGRYRPNVDILHDALSRVLPALSAQVQDVAVDALDWSGFKGVQINKDWTPDDQELIYTALGVYDGDGDMDDDAREQIIERLLAAWRRSTSTASKNGDAE